MMLVGRQLRVILVTTHLHCPRYLLPYQVSVSAGRLLLRRAFVTLSWRGASALGRCWPDPHAGEAGAFGDEEERIIAPAVRQAQSQSLLVDGPFPADSVFVRAVKGEFDGVVCLYHDQGLIPLKLLSWEDGVNVTIGLPIVRTSPDHGTAFDIAAGQSDPRSLGAAIALAAAMTRNRSTSESSHFS